MKYFVVKYSGPFGFIKPWTAVRDELTFSQQFLTPSIIEGMRQKLQVEEIQRHKLRFSKFDKQQEQTRPKLIKKPKHNFGILKRGILINPTLYLAFKTKDDAETAIEQHLCLCRNEDILLPDEESRIKELNDKEFDEIEGFELKFTNENEGFMVGFNRFNDFKPMYGKLEITDGAVGESTL